MSTAMLRRAQETSTGPWRRCATGDRLTRTCPECAPWWSRTPPYWPAEVDMTYGLSDETPADCYTVICMRYLLSDPMRPPSAPTHRLTRVSPTPNHCTWERAYAIPCPNAVGTPVTLWVRVIATRCSRPLYPFTEYSPLRMRVVGQVELHAPYYVASEAECPDGGVWTCDSAYIRTLSGGGMVDVCADPQVSWVGESAVSTFGCGPVVYGWSWTAVPV